MHTTEQQSAEVKPAVIELEIASPEAVAKHAATELAAPIDRAATLFTPFQKPFAVAATLIAEEPTAKDAASARALRLKLVKARSEIARTKDAAKADVKLVGNIIDWYHAKGRDECQAVEDRLIEIEKAEERAEAERKAKLKAEREAALTAVGVDCRFYQLGDMPAEGYEQLRAASTVAYNARLEAEEKAKADARAAAEKAEQERIAREKAEAEERERIRLENERLKKEADEKEAALKAERERVARERAEAEEKARVEREAIEAKARAEREAAEEAARVEANRVAKEKAELERKAQEEREARERLEAAEKARRDAEEKRQREEVEAAARAAAAPDREKLQAFAALVRTLEVPEMDTHAGLKAAQSVHELVEELASQVEIIASKLTERKAA